MRKWYRPLLGPMYSRSRRRRQYDPRQLLEYIWNVQWNQKITYTLLPDRDEKTSAVLHSKIGNTHQRKNHAISKRLSSQFIQDVQDTHLQRYNLCSQNRLCLYCSIFPCKESLLSKHSAISVYTGWVQLGEWTNLYQTHTHYCVITLSILTILENTSRFLPLVLFSMQIMVKEAQVQIPTLKTLLKLIQKHGL